MPVLSLACHLPHNAPHIAWRYNYEQTTKQTKAISNSYIYINISCKCDTNRAGHLTLDAYASRPVACGNIHAISHQNPHSIGSDNGLSPGRRQAIIWINAGILLIGPLGTKFSEILIAIEAFSFKKIHLQISSAKWRPFCLGLNVLNHILPEAVSIERSCLTSTGISIIKISRSHDRLIFKMEIPIPGKTAFILTWSPVC